MQNIILLVIVLLLCSSVKADLFFSSNNPFPEQTCPERYNNLYESEPAYLIKEQKAAKKKSIKIKTEEVKNDEINRIPAYKFDGSQEQSFTVFPIK